MKRAAELLWAVAAVCAVFAVAWLVVAAHRVESGALLFSALCLLLGVALFWAGWVARFTASRRGVDS